MRLIKSQKYREASTVTPRKISLTDKKHKIDRINNIIKLDDISNFNMKIKVERDNHARSNSMGIDCINSFSSQSVSQINKD